MPVPYFYEPSLNIGVNQFTLSPETSKHCVQVLRMEEGANIDITNGMGDVFNATLQTAHKANSMVTIQGHQSFAVTQQKITLGISLLKNAVRLEWLFEKATEMGIHQIVPIICERTIHERFKMDRMQNILQSAMIQSQQAWLPLLSEPIAFNAFIHKHKASVNLIAHCEPTEKKNIKEIVALNDVNLLIGPEGDFSSAEITSAISNNYTPIQLGPTRLRTETAGIFALSVLKIF
ncbi:MAG: RsmE family RNA methyltransferase [Bacteroidetes bacterium]|nr:RsmE family RNA methyltransferase [Bacteroidota bacterium]